MFEDHVTKIADCGPLKLDGATGLVLLQEQVTLDKWLFEGGSPLRLGVLFISKMVVYVTP